MELVKYDAMCQAIEVCHHIDEVKDLRDKALALQLYARQARNLDAERKASEVRLRAERRAGELLKEQADNGERARGGGDLRKESQPATLSDYGISATQSSRWQALANVPKDEFDAALRDPVKLPTTSGIISRGKDEPKISAEVLWLWGRLREFEQRGFFDCDVSALVDEMTDGMRTDCTRLMQPMVDFLTELGSAAHGR